MTNPPATTHESDRGDGALCCDDAQRLARARGVRADIAHHSDARIRRACRTFLQLRSDDHPDHRWARKMLRTLDKLA